MEVKKESSVIKKTLSEAETREAMEKLKKDKVVVSINPKKFLLEHTQKELKKLEDMKLEGLSTDDIKIIELTKTNLKTNLERYSQAKLEGYMVPLRYKDYQAIKDGVLEALKYSKEFKWDEDIQLRAMLREEHTLTVYMSLRSRDDINKRYYTDLEAIAQETETTIEELYNIYLENFVLTEQERKNF